MPGFFIAVLLAAPSVLAVWLACRLRAARSATAAARQLAEARGRSLGLLLREIRQHTAAPRLLALADTIADSLAAEAGPPRLAPAALPLAPLLAEAVATAAAEPGASRRQWRLSPDFAPLTLVADRRALHAALAQLLGRAARLTREGEWIDLHPVLTADSLAIVIEDEGAGLPAEDLSGIVPDGTRGLGSGLALARSLVEAHGGTLRLEALPGIGSRAWLTLPLGRVSPAIPDPAAPPPPAR